LEDLIEWIDTIARAEFPDLDFLDPNGVLEVPTGFDDAVRVRVELPGTEYLHLASVYVDCDREALRSSERAASSVWKGYGGRLAEADVINPDFIGTGFHTKKDHNPWFEIRFAEPTQVRRVVVRNRNNRTSHRALGLQVRVLRADGRWATIYDCAERHANFAKSVERIFGSVTDLTAQDGKRSDVITASGLARILTKVYQRDYGPSLVRSLNQMDLSPASRAKFREATSSRVLKGRELEWTSHGVRRSFRFWSNGEKRQYVAHACDVVEDLQGLTKNVCFGFGSVLAAVRDGDLIPHDDDLDIIVGFEPNEAPKIPDGLRVIERYLRKKGYQVIGDNAGHRQVIRRPNKKVDVFVGVFEKDSIDWLPGHRGLLERQMIFPPKSIEFFGSCYPIPADPHRYLELVYGANWRVPDPHYKHSGSRQEFADLIR